MNLFLPASIRSIPPGIQFALLLLGCCCCWWHRALNQTCQYFGRQLIKHDQTWSDMIRHDQKWSEMIRNNLLCCCWGVVVVDGIEPLIKLASISGDSWSNMIRHDQTRSNRIRHDQTLLSKLVDLPVEAWLQEIALTSDDMFRGWRKPLSEDSQWWRPWKWCKQDWKSFQSLPASLILVYCMG
jgi:hypothetical protein